MPLYEHVLIARQDLSNTQAEGLIEHFGTVLADNGGRVVENEYWGVRTLAYKINKNRKGHYAFLRTDDGYELMASDSAPGMPVDHGASIALSLSDDDERLREHFAGLSGGGQVEVPLETQMWGDEFGMLTDRFGVTWVMDVATAW